MAGRTQGQPKVTGQPAGSGRVQLESIKLPPGFRISLFAEGVKNARSMALGPGGTLFVGSRSAGTVYAMADKNKDGRADSVMTVATGLTEPNGVAVHNGALYVAERSRILRWDNIEAHLDAPGAPAVVGDPFPTDALHGWKVIHFGPDGMLYVTVGAPCNICDRGDPYAAIIRMKPDGSGREIFARGVRNTVGFDWHPTTRDLWFTDNGRDNLGDENPNDELNRAPKAGMHFGYPYCHQGNTPDPEFGAKRMCSEFEAPAQLMGPHVASIGMRFYTGTSFPQEYRERDDRGATRVLESILARRLPRDGRVPGRERYQGRAIRAAGDRVDGERPRGPGPSGRRPGDAGWFAARLRRFRERDLSDQLSGEIGSESDTVLLPFSCVRRYVVSGFSRTRPRFAWR